jgi:hypothetical protein
MDFKLGIAHNVLYPFFLPVEKHGFVYPPVSVTPNINLDYRVMHSCAQSKASSKATRSLAKLRLATVLCRSAVYLCIISVVAALVTL